MSDPGDETPEAMGCANDCCHPDHRHNVAVADTLYCGECFQPVPDTHRVWVGKDGMRYTNRYGGVTNIDALEAMDRLRARRLLSRDPAAHNEWRELNDGSAE